jgi:hypothetical protein
MKTKEWSHRNDMVERLEVADFYINVVACKNYQIADVDPEDKDYYLDHRVKTRDRDCRNRHGSLLEWRFGTVKESLPGTTG